MFSGFDGLMTLSRREGVDIRPTLLRVLTDLYVQTPAHTADEEQQFVVLASRLIDAVDDATRAAVRARLAIYPHTPPAILDQLALPPMAPGHPAPQAQPIERDVPAPLPKPPTEAQLRASASLAMQPHDAAEISGIFSAASASERALILHNLAQTPLKASAKILEARAARAIPVLEAAAFAADRAAFTAELAGALILPNPIAAQIVGDPGREPLACAGKALGMPSEVFQRVVMFLDPQLGSSVNEVYRIARLYDVLSERSALVMLAAWRGATVAATRAKYQPSLHDSERQRARPVAAQRPAVQPGSATGNAEAKSSTGR